MIRLPLTRSLFRISFLAVALLLSWSVSAAEPLELDFRLLRELNKRELFDYSSVLLDQMLSRYPKAKDRILVAKARTLYAARKSKAAEATIAQIPKNSPVYPEAMLLVGEASCRRGKYEEAAKAYANYFRPGEVEKRLPDGRDEAAVAEFRHHVTIYKVALEKLGKVKEAQRVIGLLGKIKGAADERGTKFLQLRTALDAEESKLDAHKPVNDDAVGKALGGLTQLVFMRDGVGALSYIEMARAHVILGGARLNGVLTDPKLKGKEKEKQAALAKIRDFIEAVNILKSSAPLLEDIVNAQGGGDELLAGALFYQGKAYRGQSLLLHFQNKDAKAEPLIKGAAKCFEKVAAEFGDSRYQSLALAEHAKCSRDAKNLFDETIELAETNVDAQLKLQLEQAQVFFQKKDYAKAIPVYLKAARIGRRSKKLPMVMSPLVVAMGREGYFIEAEALASYLVEMLPKDETTALCVLQLGASLKEAAKKERDADRKAELEDRAAAVWEWFVQIAPTSSRAPMVAYAIADQQYAKALDLARKAKKVTDPKAQEAAKTAARDAMTAAIPKFLRVVNDFGTSPFAPTALYNLGWCYYENGNRPEAADAFLRYAENDDLEPKYADQRLQAKFRAAECMMLGTQPEEAVNQFKELLAWSSADNGRGINPNTKSAKRLHDVARMDIGYSYDQVAEQLRPKFSALREQLKAAEKSVKHDQETIADLQAKLAALVKESEKAKEEFSGLEKAYTGYQLEFRDAAEKQAVREETEDPEKMTAELRARVLENRKLRVQKLETEMEKQAKANTVGELATLRETAEKTKADREALADHVTKLLGEAAELRKSLPKPQAAKEPTGEGVERLPALVAVLRDSGAVLEQTMTSAQKSLAAKQAAHEALRAEITRLETQQRAAEDQATTLRDDVVAAGDAREKARLTVERDKAEAKLAKIKDDLAAAYTKSTALEKDVAAQQEATQKTVAAYTELHPQVTKLQWECEQAIKQDVLLAARAKATAVAMPFAEGLAAALDLPVGERAAQRGKLDALATKAVAAYGGLRDARIASTVLARSHISDQIETLKTGLAGAQETVAKTQAELAPVKAEFTSWKKKGIDAFEAYLKTPGGNRENVAEVLAKVGTTYLELENFAKAEAVLSKLAKEYPDSASGKGALFNLARAQYETGKTAEAAATFKQLLAHPDAVSLGDLQYVGRVMLEGGQPAVALQACSELVARSERKSSPDYEEAQRIRGTSLFRAGRASLELKKYDRAIKYMDTLLKENPKTGFFYEIKFATAEARQSLTPPDLEGAVRDLNEVSFASDPVLKNRADYQLGAMWAGTKDQGLVAKGANRLRLVVDLADPGVPANLPWIEKAIVAAARAYARLGRSEERDEMVKAYRERFPKGQYLAELSKLPAAEFGN